MTSYLRIAGAQLPVSKKVEKNLFLIKEAIDWAAENKVDWIVTPEASLSGYTVNFDTSGDLKSALEEIEKYSLDKSINICLGTLWTEEYQDSIKIKRNQIRVYYKGQLVGITNKTLLAPIDLDIGIVPSDRLQGIPLIAIDDYGQEICIQSGGMICKDLYGRENSDNIPAQFYRAGCMLSIHSTNAERDVGSVYDKVMYDWHNASLQIVSYLQGIPLITVDSCNKMSGEEYDGMTSSPSGILIGGEWVVQAPNIGKQYFYYDLPLENLINRNWPNGPGKN
jgi:predicted amidohydrolase